MQNPTHSTLPKISHDSNSVKCTWSIENPVIPMHMMLRFFGYDIHFWRVGSKVNKYTMNSSVDTRILNVTEGNKGSAIDVSFIKTQTPPRINKELYTLLYYLQNHPKNMIQRHFMFEGLSQFSTIKEIITIGKQDDMFAEGISRHYTMDKVIGLASESQGTNQRFIMVTSA